MAQQTDIARLFMYANFDHVGVRACGCRAGLAQRPHHTAYLEAPHEHSPAYRARGGSRSDGDRRAIAPGVSAFPVGTRFEKWVFSQNGDWVGGFWPGTLWMAYLYSGDDVFRTLALDSARKLAPAGTTPPPATSASSSTRPGSPPGG